MCRVRRVCVISDCVMSGMRVLSDMCVSCQACMCRVRHVCVVSGMSVSCQGCVYCVRHMCRVGHVCVVSDYVPYQVCVCCMVCVCYMYIRGVCVAECVSGIYQGVCVAECVLHACKRLCLQRTHLDKYHVYIPALSQLSCLSSSAGWTPVNTSVSMKSMFIAD